MTELPPIFRPGDIPLSRDQLRARVQTGALQNPWRGIYITPESPLTGRRVAAFALRRPDAVFGLLTALSHHDLTDQLPRTIDAFIPSTTPAPRFTDLPHRVIRQKPELITLDVQPWTVLGVPARIVTPDRAVIDAFRFPRHLSLQIAIDALRAYLEAGLPIINLIEAARHFSAFHLIRPYLRALQ